MGSVLMSQLKEFAYILKTPYNLPLVVLCFGRGYLKNLFTIMFVLPMVNSIDIILPIGVTQPGSVKWVSGVSIFTMRTSFVVFILIIIHTHTLSVLKITGVAE